jgi:hypothetical protein
MLEKGHELLKDRSCVGSLSTADQFTAQEMQRFWSNSQNIQESKVTGSEPFPGELMKPEYKKIYLSIPMLDLMVEYYKAAYETLEFRRPFGEGVENSIIIRTAINQFGRCRIGSEVFGSVLSTRHKKSSFILAKFITNDGNVDTYPGQILYFFTNTVDLPAVGPTEHNLAYVRWYRPASSAGARYYFSINDEEKTCNVELWDTKFYPESRDCIIPVHNILGRFVPVRYKRSRKEYLAVNPINRKLNIR